MQGSAIRWLRLLLWTVCLFHIAVGAGLNLWPGMAPLMARAYGATAEWSPDFAYILKPLGAFMFALGVICIAAARDPLRHPQIIYGFVTLFVIRAVQRILHSAEITQVFGIDGARNLANMVFFFGMALSLVILERLARKQAHRSLAAG